MKAKVYSETVLHAAAERFAAETPFQIAIVEWADGGRQTVRIDGPRVRIGDEVEPAGERGGVPYWRLSASSATAAE